VLLAVVVLMGLLETMKLAAVVLDIDMVVLALKLERLILVRVVVVVVLWLLVPQEVQES
jgi:hypothetical protein